MDQPLEQPGAPSVLPRIDELADLPPEIPAFNWIDGKCTLSFKRAEGWRYENRTLADIGDYLFNVEEVLRNPEFVFRGIRKDADEYGGKTLDGLCYTSRVWHKFRQEGDSLPELERVTAEYRAQNTFMVYIHDKTRKILFTSFSPSTWGGEPRDHVFEEPLYDWRNDE
ncbi:MAG: hypothetical protein H6841_02510 [Planctomycetes bacterium]|nr:hypothetical protein [Planctomycetota bacterium]MCB9936542.1 hypothetical protein [Planctomycetota bacterium]